jgi:hypothetical protein
VRYILCVLRLMYSAETIQKFASQASRIPRALAFPPLTVDPLQGLDVLAEALSAFLQKTFGKDPPVKLYLVHAEDKVIQAARLALQQKRVGWATSFIFSFIVLRSLIIISFAWR